MQPQGIVEEPKKFTAESAEDLEKKIKNQRAKGKGEK
jgi:hypothetical protein